MLPMAKIAPAMPPPTGIFDRLICGRDVSSRMLHRLNALYRILTLRSRIGWS